MEFEFLKTALVTLLVTLDPPGLAPVFIALTLGMTDAAKREVALRACLIAFAILAAFAFGGRTVMDALGISIPAFRIAGGLLLFYIAFDMVFALRAERRRELARETAPIDHIRNVAAVPLAIPLMAGPASITATMLLAGRAGGDPLALAGLMAIVALAIAVVFAVFLAAERFSRWLGATGAVVLSRMLGVVLAALAVQFVIDGVVSVVRAGGG
jgi:multiple antibiotic resistance protein